MLPPEAIKEFKDIFERTYGYRPDDAEATRRANNLLKLYRAVLCPFLRTPSGENKTYEPRRDIK